MVIGEGTEPAVGQNNVSVIEEVPEAAPQCALVVVDVASGHGQDRSGSQRKEGGEVHDGKAAACLLVLVLWIAVLIRGGVGHGTGTSIDDLDGPSREHRGLMLP